MTQTDGLLSVQQVADILGVQVGTIYKARHYGRGPLGYRRGRALMFRQSDVDAYLERERDRTLRGEGA